MQVLGIILSVDFVLDNTEEEELVVLPDEEISDTESYVPSNNFRMLGG